MAKLSPYSLNRPPRQLIERVLTDPNNPGAELALEVRKLSAMEQIAALDMGERMTALYVNGSGIPGRKDYIPPVPLPPVGGEPVFLSGQTAQIAAIVWWAQTAPELDRYTFEEIVSFMAIDSFCQGIADLAGDITASTGESDGENPLASAASGAASSLTPSTATDPVTPPSSDTTPTTFGASTSGSDSSVTVSEPNPAPDSTSSP